MNTLNQFFLLSVLILQGYYLFIQINDFSLILGLFLVIKIGIREIISDYLMLCLSKRMGVILETGKFPIIEHISLRLTLKRVHSLTKNM